MSSDLVPTKTDGDYTYNGVQTKLRNFAQAMDTALAILDERRSRMRLNAAKALLLSGFIHNADVDTQFIALTIAAGENLGDADRDMSALREFAQDAGEQARAIRRRHRRLYGPIDEVRSGRTIKTPKPSFFETD